MLKKLRFLDPILLAGLSVSIIISLILVVIGQDEVMSLQVGLVLTTITLLIDIIARLKESENTIVEMLGLGITLARYHSLHLMIRQIIEDYSKVKEGNFDFFQKRSELALTECRDIIHGLSEGWMNTDIHSQFSFGISGIQTVQDSIKAVQYSDPGYLRTTFGERYSQLNEDAIKRGVKITRIWLQDFNNLQKYRDIIENQQSMGVYTLIAERHDVPEHLQEELAIIDSRMLITGTVTRDGHSMQERITIDPIEIERAENNYELILRYAKTPSAFFNQGRG